MRCISVTAWLDVNSPMAPGDVVTGGVAGLSGFVNEKLAPPTPYGSPTAFFLAMTDVTVMGDGTPPAAA